MKKAVRKKTKKVTNKKTQKTLRISWKNLFQFFFMIPVWVVIIGVVGGLTAEEVHAANNNQQINFQGKIVNKTAGTNIADGTYSFTFSIYDASSGGNQLWSETQSSVTVTNGIFQVALGSVTPLSSLNFTNPNLWLNIAFNGETFGSRIQLGAVPTAIDALNVDGVVATQSASGFKLAGGTSTVSTVSFTTSGSTLTLQPGNTGALVVQSNGANGLTLDTGSAAPITIGASANSITIGNNFSANNTALTLTTGGSGVLTLGSNTGTGNVVIAPNAGGQAALVLNDQGLGDIFTASASGSTKFTIANNGNVGIGTSATAPLTLLGNAFITNAKVNGTVGSATQIITGDPNTKGLIIEGTSNASNGFPSSNIESYYKFDENSGTSVGDSFAGNNGTWNGTLGSQWTTGKINSAGNFNGTNNYVNIPNTSRQNSYPFSISAWVKTTQNDANQSGIVSEYLSGSSNGFNLYIKNGHIFGWYLASSSNYVYSLAAGDGVDGGAINDGNWHFIVFTVNSSGGNIYVDNLLKNTLAWVGTPTTTSTTQALTIGDYVSGGYFTGQVDEVALWGRALGTSDISTLYNSGSGLQYLATSQSANLQEWQNSSASVLSAVSANGYIGIGTNSPAAGLELDTGTLGGNAAAIINQTGSTTNDILTASASGSTKFTIGNTGTVSIADSQSYTGIGAVTVSSGGTSGLTLNSASGRVSIASGVFLNSGVSGVTGAAAGDIWYDTAANKFKINENGTTKIICNTTDAGCGTGGSVSLQTAYTGGQTIDLSQAGSGLTIGTNAGTQNVIIAPNAGGQAALIINKQGTLGDILTASSSGVTKFVISQSGNVGIGSSTPQQALTLGSTGNFVTEMAAPTGVSAAVAAGGSLIHASYYYKITASDSLGETIGSGESSSCTSTGSSNTCTVSWATVANAVSYKIYRTSTSGSYTGTNFLTTVTTTSYSDTGAVTLTAGTPPTATTAYVTKITPSGNSWILGGNVGIGTATPLATLHVEDGSSGGNALAIFNQVGASTNDILAASASGTTKFIVHNDGSIQTIGGNATADLTSITAGAGLTILPKANSAGAGGGLILKGGNGTGAAGGGLTLDAGTGLTNGTISIGATNQSGLTLGRSGAATTVNGSSLTLGAATGVSGALTITSNGTTALTVGASGSTNPVLQVDASTVSIATGLKVLGAATGGTTAVSVIDSGANASLSIDAKGSGAITIGGTSTGNIILGTTTNGLTFNDAAGGPAYTGTARPTKKIVLSAEYPGAVLTASNSANIKGNMTSDASPSATPTSFNWQNYYMWTATANTSPTLQDYTVAVRVTLPKDFSAWSTGNCLTIAFNTPFTSNTLNALDVYMYQDGDTSGNPIAFRAGQVSGTSKNWTTVNFTSTDFSGSKTWNTAGSTAVVYLKLRSANTVNYVQVGDITLNYLAAF